MRSAVEHATRRMIEKTAWTQIGLRHSGTSHQGIARSLSRAILQAKEEVITRYTESDADRSNGLSVDARIVRDGLAAVGDSLVSDVFSFKVIYEPRFASRASGYPDVSVAIEIPRNATTDEVQNSYKVSTSKYPDDSEVCFPADRV